MNQGLPEPDNGGSPVNRERVFYFRIRPPLPFILAIDHGNVLKVHKSNSASSFCTSTSARLKTVRKLIEVAGNPGPIYQITRVNNNYFKKAVADSYVPVHSSLSIESTSSFDLMKVLFSRSGKQLSKWILNLTSK